MKQWQEVLLVVAFVGVGAAHLARPPQSAVARAGFTVNGVALGDAGVEIQERHGRPYRQLPRPDQAARRSTKYRHLYSTLNGTVDVDFDDALFTAIVVRGTTLEHDGRRLLRVGDPLVALDRLPRSLTPEGADLWHMELSHPPHRPGMAPLEEVRAYRVGRTTASLIVTGDHGKLCSVTLAQDH